MPKTDFHDYVMQDLMQGIRGVIPSPALPAKGGPIAKQSQKSGGGVTSRAMFGGWALYRDGITFGIIADDQLFFKVNETSRAKFEKMGSAPFVYESRGKRVTMKSYWELPADVAEDREELERWVDAACRAGTK